MQDCFLSADDGCVSGTQADDVQENQVIAVFNENSVSFTLRHKQCCSSAKRVAVKFVTSSFERPF
jgi:predicted secreted protein